MNRHHTLALVCWLATVGSAGCKCSRDRASAPRSFDGIDALFKLDVMPEFQLRIEPDAISRLKEKPRKWVPAVFSAGGSDYNVGVRLKGHRSLREFDAKPSFKVKFDKYTESGSLFGMTALVFNNMVEDPTMMREILGYRLYRELGVPAPRVGYAEVRVNGKLYGLYAFIEPVDQAFLRHRFEDATGGLYEGEYGCDVYPEDVPGFDRDAGDDEGRADLTAFAVAASGSPGQLFGDRGPLDMAAFLGYLAVSAFLADFDGYRHSHNYRIYHEPTRDKWSFIPWGIDRVFKKSELSVYDSQGYLAKRCFADRGCRLRFVRKLHEVVRKFEALKLDEGSQVLEVLTRDAIGRDERREYTDKQMQKERKRLRTFIAKRPGTVLQESACIDGDGVELDRDGDGYGCMDCDDDDPAIHPGASDKCSDGIDNDCSGVSDDDPVCSCPTVEIDGVTLHLCRLPMPWADAAQFCQRQGLELARIDSPEQSKQLRALLNDVDKERWWIGLSDRASEEQFVWMSLEPVGEANWAKGEPDNDACNQDCVAIKKGKSGQWHDTHCGQHRSFVCRAPHRPLQ